MANDKIMIMLSHYNIITNRSLPWRLARGHKARQELSRRKTRNKHEYLSENNTCIAMKSTTIQGIN